MSDKKETQLAKPTSEKEEKAKFTQDDVDNILSKRLGEFKDKQEREFAETLEKEKAEAERRAKLSVDEKEKELREERERQLSEKERKLAVQENTLFAKEKLQELGVPTDIANIIVTDNKERTEQNIDIVSQSWKKSVEQARAEITKGQAPSGLIEKPSKVTKIVRSF